MYFANYGLRKRWLVICLKSPVSKDPLTGNIVSEPKHCCHLNNSTVTTFSDHFERNGIAKSLFYSDGRPYKCLLTR